MNWLRQKIIQSINGPTTGVITPVVEKLRYKIGIISDAHSGYTNGMENFKRALASLKEMGAQEIISCGDSCVNDDSTSEWENYIKAIGESPYSRAQIHECNGNHDGDAPALSTFKQYSNNGKLFSVNNNNITPYFELNLFGDVFIFLVLDKNEEPKDQSDVFTTKQLDWLESELKEHYGIKGKNIFIVEHALFYAWGAGDVKTSPKYPGGIRITSECPNNMRLKEILCRYPNCIMLHGHSHFSLTDTYKNGLIIYAEPGEDGGGCHQLHVPSITAMKYMSSPTSAKYTENDSECWLCEVYTNKIVFKGKRATGTSPNIKYEDAVYEKDGNYHNAQYIIQV